jgi:hypothetical protein
MLVKCLQDTQNGTHKDAVSNILKDQIKEFFNLDRVLVYKKPVLAKDSNLENRYDGFYLEVMECNDKNYPIFIKSNGAVFLASRLHKVETPISIGYFDKNGNFVQEKEIKNTIVSASGEDGKAMSDDDRAKRGGYVSSFDAELRVNKSLRLVFDEQNRATDNYLKTCKNEAGKTLTEIFRN